MTFPLQPSPPGCGGNRSFHSRRFPFQRAAEKFRQPLCRGPAILALGAMAPRNDLENALSRDSRIQTLHDERFLLLGESPASADIETHGYPGVDFVNVLASGPPASRCDKFQLFIGNRHFVINSDHPVCQLFDGECAASKNENKLVRV